MRRFLCHLALVTGLLSASYAESPVTIEISALSAGPHTVLPPAARLYARIHYVSGRPLTFRAAGSLRGKHVSTRLSGSPEYPAGEHDAVTWISGDSGVSVDELSVVAGTGRQTDKVATASVRTQISWSKGAASPVIPPWVKEMEVARIRAISAHDRQQMLNPLMWMGGAVAIVMTATVPCYPVFQVYILVRLRGKRRMAAAAPLIVMLPVYAFCAYALSDGSTLWPLSAMFTSPFAFAYVLIVWLGARKAP